MRLSKSDRLLLRSIVAPEVVAVPPGNPHRDLCQLPNGEIRFYGQRLLNGRWQRCYLASRDAGLSWKTHLVTDDEENGPMVRSPWSGDFITVLRTRNYSVLSLPALNREPDGVYVIRSTPGPGSTQHSLQRISDRPLLDIRQPIPMRSRQRWLCTAQTWDRGALTPVVLRSDDDGRTWQEVTLASVAPHVPAPPHQGVRWQQYSCEPSVIELGSGRLLLISRTSQDVHYVYTSDDAGATWTQPAPSPCFHATTTMPTLFRLRDGRILFFWCNTQPLPELDHAAQAELNEDERRGVWEDVFTNRDACHAAISDDDGQTWRGFREIHLNDIRNYADFRSVRSGECNDKSVHQFEALELPEGKVLLAFGQAPSSRRMVIFDPQWLCESERQEDFRQGLVGLSTQVYVRSLSGGHRAGFSGHCAWNRTHGALLVPSPDGTRDEVLHLTRIRDPRLFSEVQGAAWNFPAARAGVVTVVLRIVGADLRISLTDRWFNPIDVAIAELAQLSFTMSRQALPASPFWTTLRIRWDLAAGGAEVTVNDRPLATYAICSAAPAGFSYLHLQNTAAEADAAGIFIRRLEKR